MPSPRPRPATPALLLALLACTPSAPPPASEPATRTTKPDPAATRPAAAPVAPPPEALTADERAAAGGRIVFLAERPDGATIDELSPTGGPTRTLLKGPPAAGPTIFPGPLAPDGAHMIVVTVDEQDGVHRERLELRPLTADALVPLLRRTPDPVIQCVRADLLDDLRRQAQAAADARFREEMARLGPEFLVLAEHAIRSDPELGHDIARHNFASVGAGEGRERLEAKIQAILAARLALELP